MSGVFQGLTSSVFALCEWLSAGGQNAEKNAPSTATQEGSKSVAFTPTTSPLISPPVQHVPNAAKLTVELVPQSSWFSKVHDHVNTEQRIRVWKQKYQHYCYVCELCKERGSVWSVDCHKIWHDNDTTDVQTLVRLSAVCLACHAVKHMSLAELTGHWAESQAHVTHVNEWTDAETEVYQVHVRTVWEKRRQQAWKLDLSLLELIGLVV